MKIFWASTIMFVVVTLHVMTVSAYTGAQKDKFIEKMTELADKVEVEFDNRRANYCQAYGSQFAQNVSAWSAVRTQCLENMLLELENQQDENEDYELLYGDRSQNEENKMLFDLVRKCAKLTTNPCDDQDWSEIKKCVRELYMAVPVFQANTVDFPILSEDVLQDMNVDHVLSERMMLAGLVANVEIGKCTSKTLLATAAS